MSLDNYRIIESTLREGEQFIGANFSRDDKIRIARALDAFGVEYLELTSPLASPGSLADLKAITGLGLNARILTHIRCRIEDARIALDTGVDGLDVVIGASSQLRKFSHGMSIDEIIDLAAETLTWIRAQAPDIELRFSTEDSFRSEEKDLLRVYLAVDKLGVVDRFGVADTVGIATPMQVYRLVDTLRRITTADIEFHGHNDAGSAIANAFAALEGGATHIDTTVLGIGERNGITSLGGFIARMYTYDRATVRRKYRLTMLRDIELMIADMVGIDIPFNNPITGYSAFTHKAGIHAKAILNAPETYEALDPTDFGLTRYLSIAHRLTGWNAVKARAEQLGLDLSPDQIKALTRHIKALADERALTLDDVDELLYHWADGQEQPASQFAMTH
ncbi:MAG TPA: homocitrate synthase [Anaerolineae bacterium]|nr:homocitrate synthase [Caldilineae bacterium]HID34019.1 homocitrate synthase [Anaerolineae bacterium]